MGRILSIDYGIKRTGLAVTDELKLIAHSLATVDTSQLMDYLVAYCASTPVECFVVGQAKQMDNTPSESARVIEPFVTALCTRFDTTPVVRVDERFTSKMAFQSMIDSGLSRKQRRNKATIDAVSATLILQTYMQMLSNGCAPAPINPFNPQQ
ncbi:MAG: Holliday junction resolvase RuvX [Bacteroidales bacterium]|nr:Holliday junction resolvase RuvX [Bacteroidales bacterium]